MFACSSGRCTAGEASVNDALVRLRGFPYDNIEFARLDSHGALRNDFPEAVFCPGKTTEQVMQIVERIRASHSLAKAAQAT